MKHLTFLPVILTLSMPVAAQESVEIKLQDGSTKIVSFDELLDLQEVDLASVTTGPIVAVLSEPSVSITPEDTGVAAEVTIAPVIGQDDSTAVLGEDTGRPAIGAAQDTDVIVGITKPTPPTPPQPTPKIAEMTFPGMNYETNKYAITPEGMKRVAVVAQIMAQLPDLAVQITGHTDDVGTEEANLTLSRHRASSFRQALIDHYGIDPSRITSRGLGESEPSHDNATEDGRYANRRIVVTPL